MESNNITVVIVTFKSEGKIFSCINSIPSNVSIIVVENSNNTKFKQSIESKYTNVKCLLTGENKGYASANNIGLQIVKTKYALVLNPDATLNKDTLNNFLNFAEMNKDFSLIGPANNQQKKYQFYNKHFLEVDYIRGFAIFLNLEKFNGNFFDENYFLYWEEVDLCKKVKNEKGKIYVCENILINHEGANSVKKENQFELEKNRNWHWMWSTFYYHKKHSGFLFALILIFPKFLTSLIRACYYLIIFSKQKRDIYFHRMNGLLNSILGKKSWYRPSLD